MLDDPDRGLELYSDATALAPERLLVFEVRSSISSFANAIRNVPGLDLIDEEELPDDDDDKNPAAYLVVPSDAALRQVVQLWRRWEGKRELPDGLKPWRNVFETLRDVRAWGPQDRVSDAERSILQDEIVGRAANEFVSVELELVFRRNEGVATEAEVSVVNAIGRSGGKVHSKARIRDIGYHAILSELPVSAIKEILQLKQSSIVGLESVQYIRPQSLAADYTETEVEQLSEVIESDPSSTPILAILDGVPMQRHPLLTNHVIVDDVFELEENALVSSRVHGTAMASLIVHGDRNSLEPALPRKIVSVPVMGNGDEFPKHRLIVDLIYQAVVRLKDGENASAPHVAIVNISLGNKRRPFHGALSPWARLLDRLAHRYGILFLVSAGNITDEFQIAGFSGRSEFEDATPAERSAATIKAIDAVKAERRVFSPAETVNGITVGSRNYDWVPDAQRFASGANIDPFEGLVISNPSSALGPGFAKSVKPDLLFPGAREHLNVTRTGGELFVQPMRRALRTAGLKVAAPPVQGDEAAEGYSNGTSAAAALASRTAHRIHDALEAEYGNEFLQLSSHQRAVVLKALLAHPASWPEPTAALIKEIVGPSDGRRHVMQKDNIRRFLGFGTYRPDDAVACASDRATFWATGVIRSDENVPIPVPIPAAFGGKSQLHSISATLAWMTPVNPGRQSYRAVRLRMNEPAWLGSLAVKTSASQPDKNQVNRGTISSRTWVGDKAAVVGENETANFEVVRMPDNGLEAEAAVSFALAVTISMPGVNEIYEQVRDVVRPQPRQRA